MKAAVMNEYGGPDVVRTIEGVKKPEIAANQVLVEVRAAGVNPFDWKVREGLARSMGELHFPAILGGDFSGIVRAVGAEVTSVNVGDEVYGVGGALSSHGTFAEFAPVSGGQVAIKPSNLNFVNAAAIPLVGVSALQGIVETLNVEKGQKVLVHGGSGGIGSVAIQLAKYLGAHVATTVDAQHADFAKQLGADEIIDYKTEKFTDKIHGYDAVFDTVGGDTFTDSFKVLAPGGLIATMAAAPDPTLDARYDVTSAGIYTIATTERLAKLTKLIEAHAVKVHVSKTFHLDEAAAAINYIHTGHPKGKVVITVGD